MVLKTQYGTLLVLLGVAASGCGGGEAALETDAQMASYAVGLDIGRSLAPAAGHLDVDAFARGVADVMAEREPALADSVLQGALQRFSETIQAALQEEATAEGQANMEEGQKFMAENGAKAGVTTTASGVQYEVLQEGTGPKPQATDQVTVHYRGTLIDGTEFDSSIARGQPTQFAVNGVIPGFTEALQLMSVGSKYRVVIPGHLAYGEQGTGGAIGPNETLIFEIELISIP
jgi:FKBP-type peptidyl-prolyl cis-trans isomerase